MEESRFVELSERERESLADLACSICHKICIDAMRCMDDHFFCRRCIHSHLETSSFCPVDKQPLTTAELLSSKLFERLISRLSVRCDNVNTPAMRFAVRSRLGRPTGCRWTGPYSELKVHLQKCPFRSVKCTSCGRDDIPAIGLASHQLICLDRLEACDMCHTMVLTKEMAKHRDECPAANVVCPNHCLTQPGISSSVTLVRRRNLDAHLKICPNQMVKCEFAEWGCSFKGYKSMIGPHMTREVAAHVGYMKKEVKRLGGMMATVRDEVIELRSVVTGFREGAEESARLRKDVGMLRTEVSTLKRLLTERAETDAHARRTKVRKLENMEHSDASHRRAESTSRLW